MMHQFLIKLIKEELSQSLIIPIACAIGPKNEWIKVPVLIDEMSDMTTRKQFHVMKGMFSPIALNWSKSVRQSSQSVSLYLNNLYND